MSERILALLAIGKLAMIHFNGAAFAQILSKMLRAGMTQRIATWLNVRASNIHLTMNITNGRLSDARSRVFKSLRLNIKRILCHSRIVLPSLIVCLAINSIVQAKSGDQQVDFTNAIRSVQPPRPAGRAITMDDLSRIIDIAAFSVSPNGEFLAYQLEEPDVASNRYELRWFVVSTSASSAPAEVADGGELRFLSEGGSGIQRPMMLWSRDSQWLLFARFDGREVQLWRVHRSGGQAQQLTHNASDIMNFALSRDGRKVFFSVGLSRDFMQRINRERELQGYRVREPIQIPMPGVSVIPPWPICGDYAFRFAIDEERRCKQTLWVLEIDTHDSKLRERRATTVEEAEYQQLVDAGEASLLAPFKKGRYPKRRSPDGAYVLALENEDPEIYKGQQPLLRMTVSKSDGRGVIRCPDKACVSHTLDDYWWSSDGKEVIFLARTGPRRSLTSLYRWSPGSPQVKRILQTEDRLVTRAGSCQLVGERLICVREGWTQPGQIVSIDLHTGRLDVILDPNPQFKGFRTTKIEKWVWNDGFGNEALAHLVYPQDYQPGQRYPLIITTYRSHGFLRGSVGDEQPISVYAQEGFAVLSLDIPESIQIVTTRLPIAFMRERHTLAALEHILDELSRRQIIDPKRVGITGLSLGASIVDWALTHSQRFAVASSAYSISAPMLYYLLPEDGRATLRQAHGGAPFDRPDRWRETSLGLNATRINVPYLIQAADREYAYTLQNYIDLKDADKPVELILYPGEYHVKWQPVHRYNVYRRNVQWLKFWLQGWESDDPADREQYYRWRKLREHHESAVTHLNYG